MIAYNSWYLYSLHLVYRRVVSVSKDHLYLVYVSRIDISESVILLH